MFISIVEMDFSEIDIQKK